MAQDGHDVRNVEDIIIVRVAAIRAGQLGPADEERVEEIDGSGDVPVAVGACAISGGPFVGQPEVHDGAGSIVPVDLFVPGCPPHPHTTLDGILRLLGRLADDSR